MEAGAKTFDRERFEAVGVWGIALAMALLHMLTNNRYGFHRDELQVLSDARHMAWGFVAYPPLTPFLERIGLAIFGVSLIGLRFFSVIAQTLVIVVAGLMTREFGGRRLAQVTAALAVALSPLPLFEGTEFQYSSFDLLWWVLIAYFVIRLLQTGNPRWWLAVGAAAGLGLMTKYTILFFLAALAGGLLLTPSRRYLRSFWFWAAAALALLIFLPNLLWQIRHDFISLDFLRHIHARDVRLGRANGFLRDQLLLCINPLAAPLCFVALWQFWRGRYRLLTWMYLIPLALFLMARGRGYYLAAAYPMLIAMGAVAGERWVRFRRRPWIAEAAFFTGLAVYGLLAIAALVPLAASGPLRDFGLRTNGDLREEIGWNELVGQVAAIRAALPPGQRANVGILVGNYGEQGAVEIFGPAYQLPVPISMTNSAWLRGYPQPPPTTLIVLGFSQKGADRAFASCRKAGEIHNPGGISNEESSAHPDIFVCNGPRLPWPDFWKTYQNFG